MIDFDHPAGPLTPEDEERFRKQIERMDKIIPAETRNPEAAAPTQPSDEFTMRQPIPIDTTDLWRQDERWYMRALIRVRDAAVEKVTDPALLRRVIGMLTEWLLNKLATKVLK